MIIVTGEFTAKTNYLAKALELSLEHVKRSRLEDGCISHSVQQDIENPARLVFFEEWRDMNALSVHFSVPASQVFAKSVREFAIDVPRISIFNASQINSE